MIVSKRPLVGVTCCTRFPEDPLQAVAERYLRTAPLMEADFVLIPSMSDIIDIGSIVGRLDGMLLTGSPSNVSPERYRSTETGVGPFDPARDETTLRLIAAAVEAGSARLRYLPRISGDCRGVRRNAQTRISASPTATKSTTRRPACRWRRCSALSTALTSPLAAYWNAR